MSNKELSPEEILTKHGRTISGPALEAMEEYASQWKQEAEDWRLCHDVVNADNKDWQSKYDELKAENRVQQAAIELLVEKYKAQKERAECCRNVLQDLVESIPNQTEDADWWPDSLRTAIEKANEYIQDWQNKEGV